MSNSKHHSLKSYSDRLDAIEKNGGSHSSSSSTATAEDHEWLFGKWYRYYPNADNLTRVKLPSKEFVAKYMIENQHRDVEDIKNHIDYLVKDRYWFPERYKNQQLATGELYLLDNWEEYAESAMNGHNRVYRDIQRARRKYIHTEIENLKIIPTPGRISSKGEPMDYHLDYQIRDTETVEPITDEQEYLDRIEKFDEDIAPQLRRELWSKYNSSTNSLQRKSKNSQ